jgi:hypothetical protein
MPQTTLPEDGRDPRPPATTSHRTGGQATAPLRTSGLVARASAGDQGAWDQFVERYGGLVWAVARAHGLDREDASEVSQVTWLLLTQHLDPLPEA